MLPNNYPSFIESRLDSMLSIYNKDLCSPITYSLLGGKMIRGSLLLMGLNDLGINFNIGLDIACALEMIQAYSLVHDDLPSMDNDDYRRGKLSNHKAFGEGVAVLVGDALLNEAYYWISQVGNLNPKTILDIIKTVTSKLGANGMILGQYLDLTTMGSTASLEEIKLIRQLKTVNFFETVMIIVGLISKSTENIKTRMEKIGFMIGHAFQIKDNLDDYYNEESSDKSNDRPIATSVNTVDNLKRTLSKIKSECIKEIIDIFGRNDIFNLVERIFYEY